MKKSDLKSGMKVVYAEGTKRIVLLDSENGNILIDEYLNKCNDLKNYDNDLIYYESSYSELDIVKVYSRGGDLLWTKPQKPIVEVIVKVNGKEVNEPLSIETAKRLGIVQ